MSDVITALMEDHQTVERLFTDFETSQLEERKEAVVKEVIRELSIHAAAEEQLVYPAIRLRLEDGSSQADHAIEEHQQVKRLLADLEKLSAGDPQFDATMRSLIQEVRSHVEEEERDILPKLREKMDAATLERMGDLMQKMKGLLPTHPHPMVPGTATAQLLAGPLASIADHLRDFVDGMRNKS